SVMTVSPSSGDIQKWEPYSEQSLGRRLRGWVKPLHTGEAAGLAGQVLSSLAAFGWIVLVYTGFALAWRRFFGKKLKKSGDKKS
ncbi:MAG: PepSY domain-containing protein, partial [Candidatus Omnitrophica bacterium]|nr:PepSY domain-containing protein [Candidatus Omnitrophota bacterium]